jgi:hypothetical protein
VETIFQNFQSSSDNKSIIIKGSTDPVEARSTLTSLITSHQLTNEKFRSFTIISHLYIHKSIEDGQSPEKSGFDQGAYFRMITQNDQSVYYKEEKPRIAKDIAKMTIEERMDH